MRQKYAAANSHDFYLKHYLLYIIYRIYAYLYLPGGYFLLILEL